MVRLLIPFALILVACPADDYEGDSPGECSDAADNDRDGLYDCDDPDCEGSSDCAAGDDDDSGGPSDDDDAGDDDDSGDDDASDDDDAGDDDDSGPLELADSSGTWIEITAPNYGLSLAVDTELITIEGLARDDLAQVTWSTDAGATGTADGVAAWAAVDVPLVPGDNVFTATASDAGGGGRSVDMMIVRNDSVPFGSGLELGPTRVHVDEPTEVVASVWLNSDAGLTSVQVGPTDSAGILLESWATLEHPPDAEDGFYTATFIVEESALQSWSVRAVASFGADVGSTPPRTLEVIEGLTEADFEAGEAIADAAVAAWAAAGGSSGGAASRDAALAVLLAEPGGAEVGTSDDGGLGAWWITDAGIPYLLMNNPPGTKGGAPSVGPRLGPADGGVGELRSWTWSSAGMAGRGGLSVRTTDPVVGDPTLYLYQPYDDDFGDDPTFAAIEDMAENLACPPIPTSSITWKWDDQADLAALAASTHYGLQHISTHGDTYLAGSATKKARWEYNGDGGVVALYTRDTISASERLAYRSNISNGDLAIGAEEKVWAVLPKFITHQYRSQRAPGSVVVLSACRSFTNSTMRQAYIAGGARAVVGYTEYVHAGYANERDWAFWSGILSLKDTGDAFETAEDMPSPDTIVDSELQTNGAQIDFVGNSSTSIANGAIRNPGFEEGTDVMGWPLGWIETTLPNQADWQVGNDSNTYPGHSPSEGSNMAWAMTDMDGPEEASYAELQHPACFNPGDAYSISFDWSVVTSAIWGCSNGSVPIWLFFRFNDGSDNLDLWTAGWTDICPDLTDTSSYWRATAWQTQTVILATNVEPTQNTQLRVSLYGAEWEPFYLFVDNLQVSLSPE